MKIYVVGASRNKFLPLNDIREKFIIDSEHSGDNIDNLNPWYCELTGLYHLWKNVDDDIVGLEHYRRYFCDGNYNILSKDIIERILSDHDIICIRSNYSKLYPVKRWLEQHNKMYEMQKFLVFAKYYVNEEYFNTAWEHLNGTWHCLGNMFICKKELINDYCEFIFDLLNAYTAAEAYYHRPLPYRILGYFTEFLFGVWLTMHNKKIFWNMMRMVK